MGFRTIDGIMEGANGRKSTGVRTPGGVGGGSGGRDREAPRPGGRWCFVLDVRPTLVGDGKHLSLDLKTRLRTTDRPQLVPYRKDEPFVVHEYRAEAATLLVTAYLLDGGAMAFLRGAAPGRPGHQIAFLVTARSTPITGRK